MDKSGAAVRQAHKAASYRRIQSPTSWGLISAMLALLLLLLIYSDWLWRWDYLLYDSQLSLWSRPAPDDIVIVAIDNASLARLGRWPWRRELHARLVDRLSAAGASAIFLDILFSERNPQAPDDDQALAQSIARSGRVILPIIFEQSEPGQALTETIPIPALVDGAAALGHVHIDLDQDGIARRIYLREGIDQPRWPHVSLAMLQYVAPEVWRSLPGTRNQQPGTQGRIVRDHQILLPFAGPPGHFRRIAYHQVLEGDYPPAFFKDKLVLVGAVATGLGDTLPTPVSGWNQPMSGVEINANLIDALRQGIAITNIDTRWHVLMGLLLLLLPYLLYPRLLPRYVLLTGSLTVLATLTLSAVLLHGYQIWFPPAATLLVLMLGYPIWSLLRLEHTVRYFEQELARLRTEPRAVPFYQDSLPEVRGLHFLQQVIPFENWVMSENPQRVLAGDPGVLKSHANSRVTLPLPDGQGRLDLIANPVVEGEAMTGQTRSLLAEYLSQFTLVAEREPRGTAELLERQIGEVQLAIEDLRSMRGLISDTLRQMLDGVLVVNSGGQVVLANRQVAPMLGMSTVTELNDKPILPLVSPLELNGWQWPQAFHDVLIEKKTLAIEGRLRSGKELLVQISALAVSRSNQHGMILILSDITRLKQSERKRAQALNFLSHDLRSPITSLLSLTQLKEDPEQQLSREEMAERVEHYARKALRMADSFLQLARAENIDSSNFHETDFSAIAHNALDEVFAEAQNRKIDLIRQIEVEEVWLTADANLLERALINLLENAVRYSPAGSQVRLQLRQEAAAVVCTVEDRGVGIPIENRERIFEPFQRLGDSQKAYKGGSGLGLAFVRVVAEKHRGSISVEGEPGAGSCFRLEIPLQAGGENLG